MTVTLLKSQLCRLGGAEKYALKLAEICAAKGKSVRILTTGPILPKWKKEGISIISFPIHTPFSFDFVRKFDSLCLRYLEKNPTPYVLGLDHNSFQTHLRASNGLHSAYLQKGRRQESLLRRLSFRWNPLHRMILSLERQGVENSHLEKIFVNSHMVKEEFFSYYPSTAKKIEVLHNGVEWREMQNDYDTWEEKREEWEEQHDRSPFRFLFIGNNYRRKGLEPLLKGLALLKKEAFSLSVVGRDKNAAYFQKLCATLEIRDRVTFHGHQAHSRPFYQISDCLVLLSDYDPFANVTLEALAMGLFVVTSSNNGAREVLQPSCGISIKNHRNIEEVAEALRLALQSPKTQVSSAQIRSSVAHLDFGPVLSQFYDRIFC
jgi:UDP-glucose:(heptosyl)LPS alpha-1,3-glucosyltransferase